MHTPVLEVVDDAVVKVLTTEVRVSCRRLDSEHSRVDREKGHIERTT